MPSHAKSSHAKSSHAKSSHAKIDGMMGIVLKISRDTRVFEVFCLLGGSGPQAEERIHRRVLCYWYSFRIARASVKGGWRRVDPHAAALRRRRQW